MAHGILFFIISTSIWLLIQGCCYFLLKFAFKDSLGRLMASWVIATAVWGISGNVLGLLPYTPPEVPQGRIYVVELGDIDKIDNWSGLLNLIRTETVPSGTVIKMRYFTYYKNKEVHRVIEKFKYPGKAIVQDMEKQLGLGDDFIATYQVRPNGDRVLLSFYPKQ